MSKADRLRALAAEAEAIADTLDHSDRGNAALLSDVIRNLMPPIRVYTSKAMNGRWYTYVSLPKGFVPKTDRMWILNGGDPQSYYWKDFSSDTEKGSLKRAITELVDEFVTGDR